MPVAVVRPRLPKRRGCGAMGARGLLGNGRRPCRRRGRWGVAVAVAPAASRWIGYRQWRGKIAVRIGYRSTAPTCNYDNFDGTCAAARIDSTLLVILLLCGRLIPPYVQAVRLDRCPRDIARIRRVVDGAATEGETHPSSVHYVVRISDSQPEISTAFSCHNSNSILERENKICHGS